MTSREKIQLALNHWEGELPVDFGTTGVTGIHCRVIEGLRRHYGLEDKPVKVIEPFQMLGEVDEELQQIIGTDVTGILGRTDMMGCTELEYHLQTTSWGQKVLISKEIDMTTDSNGSAYVFAKGDRSYPPSAVMPSGCYFFNGIERKFAVDDDTLDINDNLEEFGPMSDIDLEYFVSQVDKAQNTGKAVIASFGGAALGDIAFIPGMSLKDPKGIRSVAEWYMSTIVRSNFINKLFDKQIDIAIDNYRKLWDRVGDKVDVVFTCGTDFGTQESQFCSAETYSNLWLPHYKRMNDWIHLNTTWKVFKHCCGSITPLIPAMIESGFDILNPVQINAKNMNPQQLKDEFGQQLVFWGGGIDTQQVLPNASPSQVKEHVRRQCEIFGKGGGFVFNSVHNVQANAPIENVVAMFETLNELRNKK
ncbi:MAG: methyltransferase [Tannerella sp.]|jgi:hypothetical protein|nr:methyltransferase [Tannerella sp.]